MESATPNRDASELAAQGERAQERQAVVSIAAGSSQLPLIEAAKRLGWAVIAVDRDPDAPGMVLADGRVVASTHDVRAVLEGLEVLRSLDPDLRPIAVATKSSGRPVETCAEVAAALGLPGLNPAWAGAATHKPGQLAMCELAGVPVPPHVSISSAAELGALGVDLPLVCKPARTRVGKRGIRVARTAGELGLAFAEAQAASEDGRVELERYLPGRDVVLAGIFARSRFHPVVLFDEDTEFAGGGDVRGLGFRMPSTLSETPFEQMLVGHAQRLVERLDLGAGVAYLTFRVLPKRSQAHVLEIHFDLAGDQLAETLFPAATDFPWIEATLEALAGRGFDEERHAGPLRPTVMRFLHGRDLAQDGPLKIERLRELPQVLAVEVRWPAAGEPPAAEGERLGYCLARGGAEQTARIDRLLGRATRAGASLT